MKMLWQVTSFILSLQTMYVGVKGQGKGAGQRPGMPRLQSINAPLMTTRLYDPHYGYKQYWPGGDWMINETPEQKKKKKEKALTTPEVVCGEDCPEAYRKIKQVCVRNSLAVSPKMREYTTIPTYCQFLNQVDPNCRVNKWWGLVLVHIGPCLPSPLDENHYGHSKHHRQALIRKNKLLGDVYSSFKLKYSKEPFENVDESRLAIERPPSK